jgi:hypothetical protein
VAVSRRASVSYRIWDDSVSFRVPIYCIVGY